MSISKEDTIIGPASDVAIKVVLRLCLGVHLEDRLAKPHDLRAKDPSPILVKAVTPSSPIILAMIRNAAYLTDQAMMGCSVGILDRILDSRHSLIALNCALMSLIPTSVPPLDCDRTPVAPLR